MGKLVYAQLDLVVASDSTQDIWNLIAPSTHRLKLHGWELTSSAVAAAVLDINLHFVSDNGTGGDAATEVLAVAGDAPIVGVLITEVLTPGTPSGALMSYQWEQLGPVGHIFTPEMRPECAVSNGFALTLNTAATPTLSGWVCWEEL